MNTSTTASYDRAVGVKPATPPKQCIFMIACGFLSCRVIANLTRSTLDGPRKRYKKQCRVYQQYMEDQEKQDREDPKTFKENLREGAKLFNVRRRLRRHRYATKEGSPPPRQPPCCPHWDKARPKTQKKTGTERLRVYEPGHVSRLERYEERLRDPTSKESRSKAAREARCRLTATASTDRPEKLEAELESMSKRMQDIETRNAELVEALSVELARARQNQPEEDLEEAHRDEHLRTEAASSGGRSLGTIALKGRDSTKKFERHEFE